MKPQINRKTLVQLSLGSTVVVLAVILVYLGFSGRSAQVRPGVSNRVAGPALLPRGGPSTPAPTVTGPASSYTGAPPRGPQIAQTTPGAGKPSAGKPSAGGPAPAAAPGKPAPAAKPGTGPSAAPGSPGQLGPSAPVATTAPAKPQDPEAAFVGTGQRGRHDPFSPLAVNEPQRASPGPALPPPPGVGLPMPPGFAAPGAGPGATAPSGPGAGMKVTGIMGSRARVAIIEADGQTHIVGVGERVGDAVVVSIQQEKVVMKQHNVTFELAIGGDRSS